MGSSVSHAARHTSCQCPESGVVLPNPACLTLKQMSFTYDMCPILYMLQIHVFHSLWGGKVDCWKAVSKISGPEVGPVCTGPHPARFRVTAKSAVAARRTFSLCGSGGSLGRRPAPCRQ